MTAPDLQRSLNRFTMRVVLKTFEMREVMKATS